MQLLACSGIHKRFPSTGTQALAGADFFLEKGEVHALVGENGAGKSTLARVVCGLLEPDAGTLSVDGRPVRFRSHRDAERSGIGLVPQHSMLAPGLTVAENLALGHEPRRGLAFFDGRRAVYEAAMLADRFGFSVPPDARVSDLGPSGRREAEILRAVARGSRVLVLDEPTSILSEEESSRLFALIRRLKDAGTGIVYISHRAREILELADRVTVLRDGRTLATVGARQLDECSLAELIIPTGACASEGGSRGSAAEPVLEFRGAMTAGGAGLDLTVRSGEIVGVAALEGNSLDELEDLAAGVTVPGARQLFLRGRELHGDGRDAAARREVAYLPTDREGRGLSARSPARDNLLASRLRGYSPRAYAGRKRPREDAAGLAAAFGIRGDLSRPADALSGGNRQRLVAARELDGRPGLVIAANPAQGLDPAARASVFRRLLELREQGSAVLLLSQDPLDLAELADRSFILYRGRLSPIPPEGLQEGRLSSLLTGAFA